MTINHTREATIEFGDALDDIVILDLGDEATALAGELLAELGALVVRVEDEHGDVLRRRGPTVPTVMHAGKRSVAIDTTSDASWTSVERMLDRVDVVIGPIEPNPATRRFLDRVIERSTLGHLGVVDVIFRRDGPVEPVADLTAAAAGGLTGLSGRSEDPPNHPAGELAWKQTSLAAAEAAMALITAQRRTGRGGHLVVSAQEAVQYTTLQTANGNLFHWHGIVPNRHEQLAAGSTVLSADGHWVSFTIHPPNFPRFVEWAQRVLGHDVLAAPEWSDPVYIAQHRGDIMSVIARLASKVPRQELVDEGQARGLLVMPVNTVSELIDDPHLVDRDFFVDVARSDASSVRMAGSPFRSDRGRGRRGPAPELDADRHLLDEWATDEPARSRHGQDEHHRRDRNHHQPLKGVRIVDFTWALAGPLGTRLLADLGAEVIKIESENRLDPIRHIGPQPGAETSLDTNGVFNDANANKGVLTLNLDTAEGREIAADVIRTADIVTANFTPDRLDKWGFDAARLAELRGDLIVANMSVMGLSGPSSGWRAYGSGLVAMSGIAAHTGFDGTVPECLGTMHTDFTVPYFGAIQMLAALHYRERTGDGIYLELSQYESAVRLMDVEVADMFAGGPGPGRIANGSPWHHPHGIYPAAGDDRWVAIACRDDAERERLEAVIGAITDDTIAAWTGAHERAEIVETLRRARVPVAAVEDLADHHDPDRSSMWTVLELPSGITAEVLHEPMVWDSERLPIRRAPLWMEHTFELLVDEFGMEPGEVAELVERRVLW